MALPKGVGKLGAQAKETAQKIARPITSRIEDVKDQVATKEGLKNIAFQAGGNDPTTAIATGIALGIAGLGVGLGVKGLSKAFKGVKGLFGKASAEQEDEPLQLQDDAEDKAVENSKKLDELSELDVRLTELIDINKAQLVVAEGVLTKAQQDRLDAKRSELEKLENERESARSQMALLEAVEGMSVGLQAQGIASGGEGDPDASGIGGSLLKGAGVLSILGIIKNKIFGIFKVISEKIKNIKFKNIFKNFKFGNIFKVALKGLGAFTLLKGIFDGAVKAVDGAFKGEGVGGILQGFIGEFLTGFTQSVLSSFGINFTDEQISEVINTISKKFNDIVFGFFDGIVDFFTGKGPIFNFLKDNAIKLFDGIFSSIKQAFMENIKPVVDSYVLLFKEIVDIVKDFIFAQIRKIPGLGDVGLTDAEKDKFERQEKFQDLANEQEKLNQKEQEIKEKGLSEGFLGIGKVTSRDIERDLAEIKKERDANALEMRQLLEPKLLRPDTAEKQTAQMVAKSQQIGQNLGAQIVTIAPQTINNTQQTSVSNSTIASLDSRNNETTLDRTIRSDF